MNNEPNILCVLLSRDTSTRDFVKDALVAAMKNAEQDGIRCEFSKCVEPYGVVIGRNRSVATFMLGEWSHLLFVDDDVVLPPHALRDLVDCNADVAAGCYVFLHPEGKQIVPSITAKRDGEWLNQWFDGPHDVEAAATGCMLIGREVFEALKFPWFDWPMWLNEDGHFECISDDIEFCYRARNAGFSVISHGSVRCGHLKVMDIASVVPGRHKIGHPLPVAVGQEH